MAGTAPESGRLSFQGAKVIETTLFSKRKGSGLRLIVALALALGLLYSEIRYPDALKPVRLTIDQALTPVYVLMGVPGRLAGWVDETSATSTQLRRENEYLKTQMLVLQGRLQKYAAVAAENVRLRGLMNSTIVVDGRILVAEIVGIDPDPFRHVLMLNKGQQDGIYVGQPVLDAAGIMGQVIEVGAMTSRVLLISDRQSAVPVRLNSSGVRAIASGAGELDRLMIMYVPPSVDVKPGELLTTSGLGTRFPAGYPVAQVTRVNRNSSGEFAEIWARPMAKLDRSSHVLFLFSRPPQAKEKVLVEQAEQKEPIQAPSPGVQP